MSESKRTLDEAETEDRIAPAVCDECDCRVHRAMDHADGCESVHDCPHDGCGYEHWLRAQLNRHLEKEHGHDIYGN